MKNKQAVADTGICGMEIQLPSFFIDQNELEEVFAIPRGKITIGLLSKEMGVCSSSEDPVSLAMGAVSRLIKKYAIDPQTVGRIDVGTESHFDGSKPIKSFLMSLFQDNPRICGADSVSACYGGTAALLNSLNWMESSSYDGSYAIVVCTDVAIYRECPSLPTGGAGAVAILLGPNAPVTLDGKHMAHHFSHTYDFWKPRETHPFPMVDGKLSMECYFEALRSCFAQLSEAAQLSFDFLCCHAPFAKLPIKAARDLGVDERLVQGSLKICMRNGNVYTGSLYMALLSLLNDAEFNGALGHGPLRVLMFSYGSGLSSSMFVLSVKDASPFRMDIDQRLAARVRMRADEYLECVDRYAAAAEGIKPQGPASGFFLESIQGSKRVYAQTLGKK